MFDVIVALLLVCTSLNAPIEPPLIATDELMFTVAGVLRPASKTNSERLRSVVLAVCAETVFTKTRTERIDKLNSNNFLK